MERNHKLFVYGTLMKEMEHSGFLHDSKFLGDAITYGKMWIGASIPKVIISGNHTNVIHGEVYEVNEDTLKSIDWFEGYDENDQYKSMFVRRQ